MAGKRGRAAGFKMPDEHRVKIANSNILNRLIACAEGRLELTSTQANVGLGLMRKVLPDLETVAHTGADGGAVALVTTIERRIVRSRD